MVMDFYFIFVNDIYSISIYYIYISLSFFHIFFFDICLVLRERASISFRLCVPLLVHILLFVARTRSQSPFFSLFRTICEWSIYAQPLSDRKIPKSKRIIWTMKARMRFGISFGRMSFIVRIVCCACCGKIKIE